MPEADAQSSRLHPFWQSLADLIAVIRLLRGPILASIAAAVILFQPDQIREIYRITAADRSWRDVGTGVAALMLMCICFWWVSFRIVQSIGYRHYPDTKPARALMLLLPGLLATLPLLACGAGLRSSLPATRSVQPDLTSPWAGKAEEVSAQIANGLNTGAMALFVLAAILFTAALLVDWRVAKAAGFQHRARDRGFFSIYGLLVSLGIVAGVTAAVIAFPVAVPNAIGTVPLVAVFFIAIVLMAGQMTFWHEWTRMPFFILLTIAAVGFSAFDWNDNHEVAAVTETAKAPTAVHNAFLGDSWDSFEAWYKARPNRDRFKTTFPVYIVAAQGGGIYAAYHAATLLARLQDRCPEFSNHLFAISGVSGGSLGAAVFASTVKALAAGSSLPDPPAVGQPALPCPSMEHAGLNRSILQVPGPHEQAANKILASDFLSPLVAGTLFPNFTQHFLPFAVPAFDRARWLERAFERGWTAAGLPGPNPFEESALKVWSPTGAAPALLINMTESDSGRRVVVSPFSIGDTWEVLQFPLRDRWTDNPRRRCHGREISLSTAVGLSARFPWLTPAGSLTTDCAPFGKPSKSRLVDGGYFDNSGVETAIDVINRIEGTLALSDGRVGGKEGPRIALHLIVLTTSEFPTRSGYGLGDALEPVRALLSTREARTPITINRAVRQLATPPPSTTAADKSPELLLDRLHEARFHNPIYQMPLGWRISKASRDIIDIQNGRFWDCDPDSNYRQKVSADFSSADCIQMVVYHHLNETMVDELRVLALAEAWRRKRPPERTPTPRFQHDQFMACYNDALRAASHGTGEPDALPVRRGLQRRQRDAIEQILRLWDRSPDLTDDRWLAYMLAVVDYESGGVPSREAGCLTEKCTLRLRQQLGLLKPELNGNHYYGRGFIQLSSPDNYRRVAEITGEPIYDQPDLLLAPDVSARVLFAWMTDPRLFPNNTLDKFSSSTEFNLEQALGTYLGDPRFRENLMFRRALVQVKLSSDRFMGCIAAAKAAN